MKRHDTHLLSDESDKEGKEEDDHKYIFNSSNNSSKNSEEKYITKESKENIPLQNDFFNNNKKFSSLISTKELDNIIGIDINNNKNLLKKNKNKNKNTIKVKKLKINKDNNKEVEYNCLTYNPSLTNNIIDKNIKIKRNCISLANNIDKNKKIVKPKITNYDNLKEKEIYYYVFKGNFEGYNKIKKYMNILNERKLKLLQISKSNFSLKRKIKKKKNVKTPNNFPFLENNNNNFNKNNYNLYDKEAKQRNIYYGSKLNRLSPNKFQKDKNYILNKNKISILKCYKNLYDGLNINYFGKSPNKNSKPLKSKKMKNKIKNKIEMMYNIYIGNNANNCNFQRIGSNDSIFDYQKKRIWTKKKNSKKFMNFCYGKYNRDIINNLKIIQQRDIFTNFNNFNRHCGNNDSCPVCQSREYKNEESILKKGIHPITSNIGNDTSKNSWQKRRVYSALSRILTRKGNKNNSEYDEMYDNINSNLSRCLSISKNNNNTNKSKLDDLKKKIINKGVKNYFKKNRNIGFNKLNLNRSISLQNNNSTSNRFYSSKNQSIISN